MTNVLGTTHLTSRGKGLWFFHESKYFCSLREAVDFFFVKTLTLLFELKC